MIQYSSASLAVLLVIDGALAFAQGPPPGGGVSAPRTPEGITMGYMSQGDVKGLADFLDSTRLLERKDLVPKAVAASTSHLRRKRTKYTSVIARPPPDDPVSASCV